MHNALNLPVGCFATRKGAQLAATDGFAICLAGNARRLGGAAVGDEDQAAKATHDLVAPAQRFAAAEKKVTQSGSKTVHRPTFSARSSRSPPPSCAIAAVFRIPLPRSRCAAHETVPWPLQAKGNIVRRMAELQSSGRLVCQTLAKLVAPSLHQREREAFGI